LNAHTVFLSKRKNPTWIFEVELDASDILLKEKLWHQQGRSKRIRLNFLDVFRT